LPIIFTSVYEIERELSVKRKEGGGGLPLVARVGR